MRRSKQLPQHHGHRRSASRRAHREGGPRRRLPGLRFGLVLGMSVLVLPFLSGPANATQDSDDCTPDGTVHVDSVQPSTTTSTSWSKTTLTVKKVDAASSTLIDAPATFQLWKDVNSDKSLDKQVDTTVGTTVTTSGGIATWTDLSYGDYLVEETAAPTGYSLPSPAYQAVTLGKDSCAKAVVTFSDAKVPPATGSITVRKHAGTATGNLIDGARFQLWSDTNGNGTLDKTTGGDQKVGPEIATTNGTYTWTTLPAGKYLVEETAAPTGYTLPIPAYQAVTVATGAVTVDFADTAVPPPTSTIKLQVRKHAGTANGALVDTATFQLWNDVNKNGALDTTVDTKAGNTVSTTSGTASWAALAPGAYLVEETAAPAGYTLPSPAYQATTLTPAQAGTTVTMDFVDVAVPSQAGVSLEVRKHAGALSGQLIDTASFQLWNDKDGNGALDTTVDAKVGTVVSTSGGTYTWSNLTTGAYLVQETAAPAGYTLPSPRYQAIALTTADVGRTVTLDFVDAQVAANEAVSTPPETAPAPSNAISAPSVAGVQTLPSTGARASNELLVLLGAALVTAGGMLLITGRRRDLQR